MMRMFPVLAALLAGFATAAPAADSTPWKDVGGWSVSYYDNDQGCSASTTYDGGVTLDIGLASNSDGLYLIVYLWGPDWTWIEDGQDVGLDFRFDRFDPWTLDMSGSVSGDEANLYFSHPADDADARKFIHEFMTASVLDLSRDGTGLGVFSLAGSRNAFEEVVACTRSHLTDTGKADPFASGAIAPLL